MRDWPFEVHPTGWYQVDWSANLAPGELKGLTYFSEELILFRGDSGKAQVLSAFCPHFGAHLGHGGKVCGDDVQCPWHGWRWDAAGANTHIPYSDRPTQRGSLTPWETREVDGIVVIWYDANGDPPSWEWAGVPEFRDEEEYYPIFPYGAERHGKRRIMPQSILENFADTEHFPYVHGAGEPGTHAGWEEDGHYLNVKFAMNFGANGPPTWLTPNGPVAGIIESEAFGLGLGIARFVVEGRTVAQLIATTPIDRDHSEMFSTIATNRIPGTTEPEGVAAKWIALQQEQITHDFHIWENQRYVERPLYAGAEERPFAGVRRFAQQFYPPLRAPSSGGAVEVNLEDAAAVPHPLTVTDETLLLDRLADGAAPAAAPRSPAVAVWATVGAVFLAVQAWTWVSYLASGPGPITRFRDTTAPSWTWAIVMQAAQGAMLVVVLAAVVRHARRRRELTFEALFMLGCTCLVWLDPMLNYFRPGFFYSSNFVNVESWLGHVPGQLAPYVDITPQPILWEVATYGGVFLTFTLLLAWVWGRLRRRFPAAPAPVLFAATLGVAVLLDLVLELPFCRTGLFAYPAASHRFSVWGGKTYQFPLVECLGASLFWTAGAALVRSSRDGLTAVERGAERIASSRRRAAARFLSVTGFLHVIFLAFPMGLAQLGPWYTDRFPTGYTADLHNGWCGEGGQPYGPCPAPGVPWPVRAGPDPEPAKVYRTFPYFQRP